MSSYPIKIVYGNWFRLIQPIQKIIWQGQAKEIVDYVPAEGDVFKVTLVGPYRHEKIHTFEWEGNVLKYENNGTLPLGLYDVEICVTLADGRRLRSDQKGVVQIVKTNAEVDIPDATEFGVDTYQIGGAVFMYVPSGEGGGDGDMSNYYTKTESDAKYLQTETDPTIAEWAKQSEKPTYTAQEVGALPANTPIPSEVTESTVSGWGFTKNTGTYNKPSTGIPKTDLSQDVQTSLGKADSALQSHQDVSGKANTADLAEVAFSGDYDDLENKPTIPTLPALATVATSGSYNDLSDKPTIPSGGEANVIEKVQRNGVDLPITNKTVNVQVPTNTNELTNGAGFITSAQVPSNYPLVSHTNDVGTQQNPVTIATNTFHVWGEVSSLYIQLGAEISGVMNEFVVQFSTASGTPTIAIDGATEWAGIDTFQGGKTYQVSIVNGYAIGVEFDTITQSNS